MTLKIHKISKNSGEKGSVILKTPSLKGILKAITIRTEVSCRVTFYYEDHFNKPILTEDVMRDSIFYPRAIARGPRGKHLIPEHDVEHVLFGKLIINYQGKQNTPIKISIIYDGGGK